MKMMTRVFAFLCAAVLGVLLSAILCRSVGFRDQLGRVCHRGNLLAVANGSGIYESDLDEGDDLRDLVMAENLRVRSSVESVGPAEVGREFDLLRSQFGTETMFRQAMRSSGFSEGGLKRKISDQLRGRTWLAKRLPGTGFASANEGREFYEAHQSQFAQPVRFHAAHLFLAAPEETPSDVVVAKQTAVTSLSEQLLHGADFAQLTAEASEDDATKNRGGDLGFFSAWRIPSEFVAEVEKLKVGETSRPFRSHLGFHIVRLLERREATELPFTAVQNEVVAEVQGEKRRPAIAALAEQLSIAEYIHRR